MDNDTSILGLIVEVHKSKPTLIPFTTEEQINYTYKDFVQAVDEVCYTRLGCSVHDLPDYPLREDWEECEDSLAYVAPEDVEHRKNVFRDHVSYTCNDLECENLNDYDPIWI